MTGGDGGGSVDGGVADGNVHPRDGKADGKSEGASSKLVPIGSPCTTAQVCASSGQCTALGTAGLYCTEPCPTSGCPNNTYCSIINGAAMCVPDLMQECLVCTVATDCKLPSDACLTAPQGDTFCARDCTPDNQCPSGYTCVDKASYASAGQDAGAPGDAGTSDAGTADARPPTTDAGTPGSDASSGGEASTPGGGGTPSKWCVPSGGASCACGPSRDGEIESCSSSNSFGTCVGEQTCVGSTGMWNCTAMTPAAEICNGKDDNCNGHIDEGDPAMLCAFEGPPPANSSWVCTNGMCVAGPCAQGWTDFPPGSVGCSCPLPMADVDELCDQAIDAGSVTDVGGTPLTLSGTLSSTTAVTVYTFNTVDTDEMTTNSYHVNIAFTQPTPNDEFVMDVERSATCADAPTGGSTDITSYDWCVNATNGSTAGEAPCAPATAMQSRCADHSSAYFVRVYRKAGATPTCNPYTITVTGGGGTCDLTQTCQ